MDAGSVSQEIFIEADGKHLTGNVNERWTISIRLQAELEEDDEKILDDHYGSALHTDVFCLRCAGKQG